MPYIDPIITMLAGAPRSTAWSRTSRASAK